MKNSFNNNNERINWITYDIIIYGKIISIDEDMKNIKKIT